MTRSPNIAAIILAAGFSRRMGTFKPLMRLGGRRVIDRVISAYQRAGVADIRVVTGFKDAEIRSALVGCPVAVVHNPDHEAGMFSSVLAGISTLADHIGAFFIHPVDIPIVRPHSLALLMDAFDGDPAVVYPQFDGQRGHPPLIHGRLKKAIHAHDGNGGLRDLLTHFDAEARAVPVADQGVLLDLDTPADLRDLETRLTDAHCLNDDECRVLMESVCRLPEPIVDHCRRVTEVAKSLAEAVNAHGGTLDLPLVQAAARVHDIARPQRGHAGAGARQLQAMGFPAMAEIIAVHMQIEDPDGAPLDEAQLVYLADKLVDKSRRVDLSQRFESKLERLGHDPQAGAAIRQRWRAAVAIRDKVENLTGRKIERILRVAGMTTGKPPCDPC